MFIEKSNPSFYYKNAFPAFLIGISLFLSTKVQNFAYSYIYFIASFFILGCLIIYKLFSSYKKPITVPCNIYLCFFILFTIWTTASILWSPVPTSSIHASSMYYLFLAAFVIGFWSNLEQQKYFHYIVNFLLLIIFWKTLQQRFIFYPSLPAPGFFANKNTNAIFVCMLILPICSQLILDKKQEKKSQIVYAAILFISAFIISLTLSRGAVLGLTIGLSFLLLHLLLFKQSIIPFLKMITYLGTGYFSAELLNGGSNIQRLTTRTLSTNITTVSNGRTDLWESGWEMYLDQPILGWGINMFHWLFPQFRHAPDLGQYVHNDYFQFLIELGPLGFSLFIGFLVSFLIAAKKLYLLTHDKDDKLLSLGLITACIAVFSHSCFTFNLYQPAPLLLLGLYIGVLTNRLNKVTSKNNLTFRLNKLTSPLVYYSLLLLLSFTLIYKSTINSISINKTYSLHKNNLMALEEAENAYYLTSYNENILAIQLNLYTDLLYNKENTITNKGRVYLITRGINVSEIAINKNPFRVLNYVNKARLYFLTDEKNFPNKVMEINSAFNQAIQLDPFNLSTRFEYAKVLMEFNQKQQAIEVFKGGLGKRYYSKFEEPILYLQLLLSLITDSKDEKAIASLKKQIDVLYEKKSTKGYYTLNTI